MPSYPCMLNMGAAFSMMYRLVSSALVTFFSPY
jgi:hypothetical protein